MTFSLLTYNVLFNKAFPQLGKILTKYKPDVLCLQEVDTKENNLLQLEKFGYSLADYSNSLLKFGTVYGVATYLNPKKVSLLKTDSFDLPKSAYELFITAIRILKGGSKARTILRSDFTFKNKDKTIAIYNVHLTLFGINRTRKNQLQRVLNHGIHDIELPTIITGDFNYFPYRRKTLEKLMFYHQFKEATKSLIYTMRVPNKQFARYNFFQEIAAKFVRKFYNKRLKPDYTFFKNIDLIKTERINVKFSDHYPIISTFNMS